MTADARSKPLVATAPPRKAARIPPTSSLIAESANMREAEPLNAMVDTPSRFAVSLLRGFVAIIAAPVVVNLRASDELGERCRGQRGAISVPKQGQRVLAGAAKQVTHTSRIGHQWSLRHRMQGFATRPLQAFNPDADAGTKEWDGKRRIRAVSRQGGGR